MRLLIGGSSSFFFHLKEFSDTLNSLGVESKLVFDADYSDGFPSRNIRNWFQTKKKITKLIVGSRSKKNKIKVLGILSIHHILSTDTI